MIAGIDSATAEGLANQILGTTTAQVEDIAVGFANQNWRVTSGSDTYVLKIGPASSAAKWSAAAFGLTIAAEAGLHVPSERFSAVIEGHCVRMLDWVEGSTARSLAGEPARQVRLGQQLGEAIAALHHHELDGFTSRLDGSSDTFFEWATYLGYRLDQIRERARANAAPEPALIERSARAVLAVVPEIAASCRAVVCHRDLHVDNLIVDSSGTLKAIIDWDMPEAWDAAGEWFKLETMLFNDLPDTRPAFETSYFSVHTNERHWQQRTWLVNVIENMNVIANAPNHGTDFTDVAVERLRRLV